MNELYVFALRRGVANLLEEYRDSVIGGYAKVQQRHLPISTLSNLGR